jgi:hypothetical protein
MIGKQNEMPEEIFVNNHYGQRWGSYSLDDKLKGTSYTRSDLVQELRRDKERLNRIELEVRELREQLEHANNPVHSCGANCQRAACVMRRERDALKQSLADALGLLKRWVQSHNQTTIISQQSVLIIERLEQLQSERNKQ